MNRNYKIFMAGLVFVNLSNLVLAQQSDSVRDELRKSANVVNGSLKDTILIDKMLNTAKEIFDWKVQENDQAYMMFVDIPYPEIKNPKDYFSITVVKLKKFKRPRVISFAVSSMIDPSKGLSIFFAGYDKNHVLQMSNIQYEQLPFTEITSEYLKVSADYMYLDKNEKKDLFEPMLNNNYIVFNFYDHGGRLYKVSYPLLWFKDKIEDLK
jgi:hypothetical protein